MRIALKTSVLMILFIWSFLPPGFQPLVQFNSKIVLHLISRESWINSSHRTSWHHSNSWISQTFPLLLMTMTNSIILYRMFLSHLSIQLIFQILNSLQAVSYSWFNCSPVQSPNNCVPFIFQRINWQILIFTVFVPSSKVIISHHSNPSPLLRIISRIMAFWVFFRLYQ